MATEDLMETQKGMGPVMIAALCCIMGVCCFWLPLIFFMGAANVLTTCENHSGFTLWMKLYSLIPMGVGLLMQMLVVLFAFVGNPALFKCGMRLQAMTGLVGVGLLIWGWMEYTKTSEEKCVDGSDGINPRTLSFVFLIMGSIGMPGAICAACSRGLGDPNQVQVADP